MWDLNYRHLYYFRVVAHAGHLTRAAQQLNVSQSALSTQIRTLEARLGQPLFERRGRSLHLTEAGRIALDHADSIFAIGNELLTTLRQTGQSRRALRIGAIATLSRNFQLEFLKPVLGRTDVEVILHSGSAAELLAGLTDLNLDLVLTNQPPAADTATPFATHRIDAQAVALIGVPQLCPPAPDLTARLQSAPLILPAPSNALRAAFEALIGHLGVTPQIAAEVDDMAMIRLLAREGAGLAVIPPIVVRDELASGILIEAAHLPDLTETFYAVTTPRRFPNPLLRLLLDTGADGAAA